MTRYAPKPGDIGLVAIPGTGGKLIRALQWANADGWSEWQHAFTCVGWGKVIEAMPGGARQAPVGHYNEDEILWLRCPPQYGVAVAQAALGMIGTPYSFLDYGALALHRFRIPAPHLRAYIETSKHQICSQLADRAALLGGWYIFDDGRWPGYVTPNDLVRVALAQSRDITTYIERWKGPR
jgi:hypothetical protein